MPRKVDHDERRLAIAAVVEQLVLEHGIEALTVRDVADAVGCSTSVVSHYFRSKLDMLVFTHRTVRLRVERTLLAAMDAGHDLVACLELLLPTTDERWRDWHTWFACWGMAPTDPSVNREWAAGSSEATDIFTRLVQTAQAGGTVDPTLDPVAIATELQLTVNGIASLVTQHRDGWPPERQRDLLCRLVGKIARA